MSIAQRGSVRVGMMVAVVGVLLAGCTVTSAPEATATPEPDFPPPLVLAGTGAQGTMLDVPDGAQSLHVSLACSDGMWSFDGGTDLGDIRNGTCGGEPAEFSVVVPDRATTRIDLNVGAEETVVARLTFSADPPPEDPDVTEDCAALGVYLSAISNAEQGLSLGAIDDAGWAELIDEARGALDGMTPAPTTGLLVERLQTELDDVVPGTLLTGGASEVSRARNVLGQLCSANGTTIVIVSQYGG